MDQMNNKEFLVLTNKTCIPRYNYHRSLLEWIWKRIPKDPIFQGFPYEECSIIVGENMTEENKTRLFGESALIEKVAVTEIQKGTTFKNPEVLILCVINDDDVAEENTEISQYQLFEKGTIMFIMTSDKHSDERLKSKLSERVLELESFGVEFVTDNRSEIINKMTLILERKLMKYLEEIKTKLFDFSRTHNVGSRFFEVNAILRRLKQAACYPEALIDEIEDDETERNEIDGILHRFHDKILNTAYYDNTLYVITADQNTKDILETSFSAIGYQNVSHAITVKDKLPISPLSNIGVPLHGAKFVLVDEGVEAFHSNKAYATTGSLMKVTNNDMMVAVTCRHAVKKEGSAANTSTCYTIIENSVVKLGQTLPQSSGRMESLHDDIAVVRVDEKTRLLIDEKCEKLLIDEFELPTPATIAINSLKRGDIVHKRGARSGLTTGVVKDVKKEKIESFVIPSRTIYITGGDSEPFAEEGDSGSLVFQHSLDPEKNVLNVHAMVQSKVRLPIPNADIICFPFDEGCESLRKNVTDEDLQSLQFFSE